MADVMIPYKAAGGRTSFWCFSVLFLCIVAGIRYKVGTDFVTYGQMYEFSVNYDKPWHIFGFGVDKAATDPGFTLILWMLNQLSHEPQIMYITVGIITYFYYQNTCAIWTAI